MRPAAAAAIALCCLAPAPAWAAPWTLRSGAHVIEIAPDSGAWRLMDRHGRVLLDTAPHLAGFEDEDQPLAFSRARVDAVQLFGIFAFQEGPAPWHAAGAPVKARREDGAIALDYRVDGAPVTMRFSAVPGGFRVASEAPAGWTRMIQGFRLDAGETLYGFGARTNASAQRGRVIQNWVEEGGNGKSETPVFGVSNVPTSSHVPVPFFMSTRGYGMLLDTPRRTRWDLGARHGNRLRVIADDARLALRLFPGETPARILEAFTAHAGRPGVPPLWAMAPAEFGKGGSEAVREKAAFLRREGLPASAMWFEDWVGLERGPLPGLTHLPWGRWVADADHYPDLAGLNRELEASGFKSLGYFNPFLMAADPLAKPALDRGYGLHGPRGNPLFWLGPFGWLTQIDVTNPEAVAWAHGHLAAFERLGFDGAMVDFGEWTPRHARFKSGETGETMHNLYPNRWADLHRRFWDRARPGGDYVIYARSGYTGAPRHSTFMWAGDQNTDFGIDDGLPTALTAILSAGLSGVPLMTHDVAGFATLGDRGVTRELYYRWVELGAFSTFFRTHSGQKPGLNWHMRSDAATTAHHRRYARAHMDLALYRHGVAAEAARTGLPAMRHLVIAFPGDRAVRAIDDAYMLGPSIMVAPVMAEGATEREVYWPPGAWYDYWTGAAIAGGRSAHVPAPLEHLPVYVREGAILPLLPEGVETLLPARGRRDLAVAEAAMRVAAYPGPESAFALADGTRLTHRPPAAAGTGAASARVDGGPAAVRREGDWLVVTAEAPAERESTIVVRRGEAAWRLAIAGAPRARRVTWRLRWPL